MNTPNKIPNLKSKASHDANYNPSKRRVIMKKKSSSQQERRGKKRALDYKEQGWTPIPLKSRSKNPGSIVGNRWQYQRYTAEEIPQEFAGKKNIAIIMGKASNGLTDVDCDWPEARDTASFFLNPTMCFGRQTSPAAHWLYYMELAATINKSEIKYSFPTDQTDPDRKRKPDIVELLIGGGGLGMCAIFPGSFHAETGELIKWEPGNPGQPLKMDGQRLLLQQVGKIAASALLA
jgi:hypothetical protein